MYHHKSKPTAIKISYFCNFVNQKTNNRKCFEFYCLINITVGIYTVQTFILTALNIGVSQYFVCIAYFCYDSSDIFVPPIKIKKIHQF